MVPVAYGSLTILNISDTINVYVILRHSLKSHAFSATF
jgi:hypothetical protein